MEFDCQNVMIASKAFIMIFPRAVWDIKSESEVGSGVSGDRVAHACREGRIGEERKVEIRDCLPKVISFNRALKVSPGLMRHVKVAAYDEWGGSSELNGVIKQSA